MEVIIEGQTLHVQNVSISASRKGITTEQPAQSLLIQTTNGTAFTIYESDDDLGASFTIKANSVPLKINVATSATKPIFWVKTTGGTDTLEIISIH